MYVDWFTLANSEKVYKLLEKMAEQHVKLTSMTQAEQRTSAINLTLNAHWLKQEHRGSFICVTWSTFLSTSPVGQLNTDNKRHRSSYHRPNVNHHLHHRQGAGQYIVHKVCLHKNKFDLIKAMYPCCYGFNSPTSYPLSLAQTLTLKKPTQTQKGSVLLGLQQYRHMQGA